MKKYLLCLAFLGVITVSAKEKKILGEVSDREAFLKIQSYCVDPGNLAREQAQDVAKFIEEESKPKRVLAKLRWSYVEDCTRADVVAGLKFEETIEETPVSGSLRGEVMTSAGGEPAYRLTLLVTDRASKKVLYQVAGDKRRMRRERALTSTFSKLIKDLETVQASGGQ